MAKRKSKQNEREGKSKKKKSVPTPHDHFFRYTFLQRDHAQEFLENYLPEDILAHLNLDELTSESTTYIDERLAEHLSDVLYEVPLSDAKPDSAPASIYMLFEHKSVPEQQVLLQILRYKYERWIADDLDGKKIRPIIPIVFYHGERKWNVPTRFLDCFKGVDEIFYAFIPDFNYILFDTSEHEAEQIRQAISSGSLQASLLLLKYIYDKGLDTRLDEVLDPLVVSELPRERATTHLIAMLKYISETSNPVDEQKLTEVVRRKFANEEGTMNILVEEWLQRGDARGYLRGLKEGAEQQFKKHLEEQLAMQRKTLSLILEHRFAGTGLLSDAIAEASKRLGYVKTKGELDALTKIILTVSDLDRFLDYLPAEPTTPETASSDAAHGEMAEVGTAEMAYSI